MIRFRRFSLMFILSVGLIFLSCMLHGKNIPDTAAIISLALLFYGITVFYLQLLRLKNRTTMGAADDFRLFSMVYCLGALFCFAFSFAPGFLAPVVIFPLFIMGVYRDITGFALSIYYCLMTVLLSNRITVNVLVCYILTVTLAALLYALSSVKEQKFYISILMICICIAVPLVMEFLSGYVIVPVHAAVCAAEGAFAGLLYIFVDEKLSKLVPGTTYMRYETILDSSYILHREIKNYSEKEYEHDLKVSDICERIAGEMGFDTGLSAAGGMYYRIGRMAGEPYVENGVRIAQENCFPAPLIDIISEYDGLEKLPSSRESALVHIVDTVVLKFTVLDHDTFSGGWNRDIMVYSTMNEFSEKGMYDESGLSMNQFLKIRDLLAREEI